MAATSMRAPKSALVTAILTWFDEHERPLPWRGGDAWGVLVSEFMLQQTPVDRVLPTWREWMQRWPTPPHLAQDTVAEALRAWGRLGYPRRARWLHQSAVTITDEFGGKVPDDIVALRALPGVGEYTASAVLAFAFGRRSVVLDTNVRRVVARTVEGRSAPPAHVTTAERVRAESLWPATPARSARWSAAVMEFGALVCTARRPHCDECPVQDSCAWTAAGRPDNGVSPRRQAEYVGSDRQARGRILAVLRDTSGPVSAAEIEAAWPRDDQRTRAIHALVADGLAVVDGRGRVRLPD